MIIEKSIYQVIKESTIKNKNKIAYDFLGYSKTYQDFFKDINELAAFLNKIGVRKGDIISIYLPNMPISITLYYAINKIGAISNFIHPNMPINENSEILLKMQPKIIFILDSMYEKINELKNNKIKTKLILVKISDFLPIKYKYYYKIKELYYRFRINLDNNTFYYLTNKSKKNDMENKDIKNNIEFCETATILFTGGTTGNTKGVRLSSKNMNAAAFQTSKYKINSNQQDKVLGILPIFHGYGLVNCIHTTFFVGDTLILLPYYKDKLFKKTLLKVKPNYILGIPKLYAKIYDLLKDIDVDLSFFRGLYCGGSKLNDNLLDKFNEMLKEKNSSILLREGYGLSECVGACTLMPSDESKRGSVGIAYVGVDIVIVDRISKKELRANEVGEICISSDTVMLGYFGEKNTNIEVEKNLRWLYSGDIGYIDSQGYIYFVDRVKRMIKILAHEVFPAKIEKCINSIDGVFDSCVISAEKNDISYLKAFVVLDKYNAKNVTKELILNNLSKNLSRWSVPREIEFVSSIDQTLLKKNDYLSMSKKNK
ncbi:class I adenylate-forming enzyme family protein [Helicovermis profundi]|uniref:Long-chain fatty acid--CoA ligase n=1 Tax=Helicovermis profundi TaxID=3065157 RepID=A0AAU9E5K6_9FIRM|nr:long-chain fatty acid--CoA ligase [Clostridia bacterium S502]